MFFLMIMGRIQVLMIIGMIRYSGRIIVAMINDDNNQIIAFVRTLLMTHLCGENGSLQWAPLIG